MCAALGGLSRGLGTGPSRRRACSPPGPGSPRRPELSCRCSCLCSAPQPRRLLSRARVSTQRMKSYLVFRSPVLCPRAAETQAPVADAGLASGPCTRKRCAPLLARGWGVFPGQGQGAKREETGANGRAREQTGGSGFSLESLEGRDFRSRARGSLRQDPSCLGPWSPVLFVCVCMCTRVCVRAGRGSLTPPPPPCSLFPTQAWNRWSWGAHMNESRFLPTFLGRAVRVLCKREASGRPQRLPSPTARASCNQPNRLFFLFPVFSHISWFFSPPTHCHPAIRP